MKTKPVNLHMNTKRALFIIFFFAMLLSLNGVFASVIVSRDCAQLSALIQSYYDYSAITKDPIVQDSYYQFNAGINFSASSKLAVSINADILMQPEETSYTKAVVWNAPKLDTNTIAISKNLSRTLGIMIGDELYSKHVVDGEIHSYTVQGILPDIITARVASKRTYSDGLIIMGSDDLYINNISYSSVSYSNMPIDELERQASEIPENILYRSDEIIALMKDMFPYIILFMAAAVVIVAILTVLLTKEVQYNFKRLMILGYAKKQLDNAYWMHICKGCIPAVCIGVGISIGVVFITGSNSVKIMILLIILFSEAISVLLSAVMLRKRLWRL